MSDDQIDDRIRMLYYKHKELSTKDKQSEVGINMLKEISKLRLQKIDKALLLHREFQKRHNLKPTKYINNTKQQ